MRSGRGGLAAWGAVWGALQVACGEGTPTASPTPSATAAVVDDVTGPSIVMTPVEDGQARDVDVTVEATITDPSGVAFGALYYRAVGVDYWASAAFTLVSGDLYRAVVPGAFVGEAGVDYYVEATDRSPNRNVGRFPSAGPVAPLYFSTLSDAQSFPFRASFEPETPTSGRWLLGETGWTGYVMGFNDLQNWVLSDRTAADGVYAATHFHGTPYQTAPFEDWLVSPPVDLSLATTVDLSWWELVDHPEYATHRLMVSTTSPDPALGGYEEVLSPLPAAAGGVWSPSPHVDLSAWAGEPQVFIAFVYEGLWADDWTLDEVHLQAHGPDLHLGAANFDPAEGIRPGQTATLTLDVSNQGLASSGPLTVTVSAAEAGVSVDGPLVVEAVPPAGNTTVGPFTVSVDASHPDHTWIPLAVTLSDGTSTFSGEARLKVGRPPMAFVQITHTFENDIELALGYTQGEAEVFRQVIQSDGGANASGIFTWEVDLWEQRGALPPNISDQRWFVDVGDDSLGNTGTLDSFYIAWGEDVYAAEGLPRAIPDDASTLRMSIPGRAELELATLTVEPAVVGPGDAVSMTVSVYNLSAPPRGALRGRVFTGEADVTGLTTDEIAFTYSPLDGTGGKFGLAVGTSPFTFTVSEAHQDSADLAFTLVLTDGVDTWTLPLAIPVPYPVLADPAVIVADDEVEGAFEDYALTPYETTALRVLAFNRGALPTFGPVEVTVEVVDDGGTGITVPTEPILLTPEAGSRDSSGGLVPGGRAKTALIPVTLAGGTLESRVSLAFTLSDGTLSHRVERSFLMLDAPRNNLLSTPDAVGDAGAGVDLVDGGFQMRGTVLSMRWRSATPIDPSDLLLMSFVNTSADYRYALVWVYGEAALFRWVATGAAGYWSKNLFTPETLRAYPVDATSFELTVDLAELGMAGRDLWGGAVAGLCEDGTCDYAPDAALVGTGVVPFWW